VAVRSIDLHDQGDENAQMCALGDDAAPYVRTGPEQWERTAIQTEASLFDVPLGSPDPIVGENGTVLERERSKAATARDVGHSSDDPADLSWEPVDEGAEADAPARAPKRPSPMRPTNRTRRTAPTATADSPNDGDRAPLAVREPTPLPRRRSCSPGVRPRW
jgi:hypothetical protein